MKIIITKYENGYTVKCGKDTHVCTDFVELVHYLEDKFNEKIWDIEWPQFPDIQKPYTWPQPQHKNTCPKCHLQLEPVMHYTCTNHPCPVGLGGPYFTT